jgi:SAM-dependent methyltransferase
MPYPTGVPRRLAFAFLLALFSFGAFAQAPYEPRSGQAGKDVVWVPTPQVTVDKMLELANVGPQDFVIDLGSGDGRLVISAAKRGARGFGVEYNPDMVELARRNAEKEGVAERAQFVKADLFETDFSRATVITLFLLTDLNIRLRPKLLALKPGTRVVANTFNIGDWAPDETAEIPFEAGCKYSWCVVHLWIVPAKVEGTYRTELGEVTLKQKYQKLSGTIASAGRTVPLSGSVRGAEISFTSEGKAYAGRLKNGGLELR